MERAVGHVQTSNDPRDAALVKLYELLSAKNAPKSGSFTSLDQDQKREYFKLSRRRSRAKVRAAASIPGTAANIDQALRDAALMILATGAPGAEQIRAVLAQVFADRPGVPMSVETKAKRGKLKTKLIARKP
jgi:hypothetical protein